MVKKKVALVTELSIGTKILIYIAQSEGKAFAPQIVKFMKDKYRVKAPSTVYSSLEMLRQSGVIRKEPITVEEMPLVDMRHRANAAKWAAVGNTLKDLSRYLLLAGLESIGMEGYALGPIINSKWYVSRMYDLITPENMEMRDFFDKLWINAGETHGIQVAEMDLTDLDQRLVEEAKKLNGRTHMILWQTLQSNSIFAMYFYTLFYLSMVSSEKWPDSREVSKEEAAFMRQLAIRMKADLLANEYKKESFDGWISVLILEIGAIVNESMGSSFSEAKDPNFQEYVTKKIAEWTKGK